GKDSVMSAYNSSRQHNISYYGVQIADFRTGKKFVPKRTNVLCHWCSYGFKNLPAYIVGHLKDGCYYVLGNFCSFDCAATYNCVKLKDCSWVTRHALTNSLKVRVTGNNEPIKFAEDSELLEAKG